MACKSKSVNLEQFWSSSIEFIDLLTLWAYQDTQHTHNKQVPTIWPNLLTCNEFISFLLHSCADFFSMQTTRRSGKRWIRRTENQRMRGEERRAIKLHFIAVDVTVTWFRYFLLQLCDSVRLSVANVNTKWITFIWIKQASMTMIKMILC